jgi:transposase
MKKIQIIGIDVSKAKLDVCIHSTNYHFIVTNDPTGFALLLETIFNQTKCKAQDLLLCFENTGKYSKMLSVFLHSQGILFVMTPALEIKKSLGITRGKNDKIDARRIARYAYEKRDTLSPTVLPGEKIDKIKALLSLRAKLIKHCTAYKNGLSDLFDCYREGETAIIKEVQQRLINYGNIEIETVEKEISDIIKKDHSMDRNFKLITSVRGIGKILGFYLIAFTENFTAFADARSLACFAGIAPFANSSGTVTGKSRVHPYANKQLKSLLNMAAMSAIQCKGEFREYYNKRVEIGKNKMSSLNIIRNKILFRVFAVVRRGTPYVDLYRFAA